MSMELIWSFTGLEASPATVEFPNSPAILKNIWNWDIVEKGQQDWKTQGCKDLEADQVLPLDTLSLENILPCLGVSAAAPLFPSTETWAHQGAISLIAFRQEWKQAGAKASKPNLQSQST